MIRKQKVYYSTSVKKYSSDTEVPKIRIVNKILSKFGFKIGDEIKIEYSKNKIVITN